MPASAHDASCPPASACGDEVGGASQPARAGARKSVEKMGFMDIPLAKVSRGRSLHGPDPAGRRARTKAWGWHALPRRQRWQCDAGFRTQAPMGRIFEKRKTTMFARWNRMAKLFTRVAKDIAIAVKSGGTDPNHNPALRRALQNARAGNMPKDKVDAAIKRASGHDTKAYEVVMYEGYAAHGIAVLVETATDNVVRTVANIRSGFKENGGHFGASGSVGYLFKHMGVFRLAPEGI